MFTFSLFPFHLPARAEGKGARAALRGLKGKKGIVQSNHLNFEKCLSKLHVLVKGNATSFSNCIHDLKASVLDPEGKGGARALPGA